MIPFIVVACSFLQSCEKEKSGLPIDGDGNAYDTIVIGNRTWLRQNLKTTKYNNGVSIPLVTNDPEWTAKTSAAFCWYNNDTKYKDEYGALYNWYAVNAKTLCPVGYHVPSQDDWATMINSLGELMVGAKLKDNTPGFWDHPNDCATNETGFSARPAGMRYDIDGLFYGIGGQCYWWTSSLSNFEGSSTFVSLIDEICQSKVSSMNNSVGFSVRCIKNK